MYKTLLCAAATAAFAFSPIGAIAHEHTGAMVKSPPSAPYKAVSSLVKLPDFLPGMGQLYVDPATLPAGPFLAYDRQGLLRDITQLLSSERVNVLALNTSSNTDSHTAAMRLTVEVSGLDSLSQLLARIHNLPNVISASRVREGGGNEH